MKFLFGGLIISFVLIQALLLGVFAAENDRFFDIFKPLETEWVSLSPDGNKVAYSVFDDRGLSICVKDVAAKGDAQVTLLKTFDTTGASRSQMDTPVVVRWIGWPSADSVVVFVGNVGPRDRDLLMIGGVSRSARHSEVWADKPPSGEIYLFDLREKKSRLLVEYGDRNLVGRFGQIFHCELNQQFPGRLVFSARPSSLSRTPPDTKTYTVEFATGQVRLISEELKTSDNVLPEQQNAVQRAIHWMERHWPTQDHDVFGLDQACKKALVLTQTVVESGAFRLLDLDTGNAETIVERQHSQPLQDLIVKPFAYTSPQKRRVAGWLVLPAQQRTRRAPVVVLDLDQPRCLPYPLPSIAHERVGEVQVETRLSLDAPFRLKPNTYRPEVVALASMGFAVVQLSEFAPSDTDPIAARISEVKFAIDQLAREYTVSSRMIALYGSQMGANLAIDILHRAPDLFRCMVAIEPYPIKSPDGQTLAFTPEQRSPLGPPLAFATPMIRGKPEGSLSRPEFQIPDFPMDYNPNRPRIRARAFRLIEDFLNVQLYNYRVEAGETKVINDE